MQVLSEMGSGQAVLVVMAVVILIVLVILMSTRRPGPPLPGRTPEPEREGDVTSEESEVEGPG